MRVSAQAMCLYSQPTQASNFICRVSPPSYHSDERKDSCSQQTLSFTISTHLHVSKALALTQPQTPDLACKETYSILINRFQLLLNVSEPNNS